MRQTGTDYQMEIMGRKLRYREAVRIRNRSLALHTGLLAVFALAAARTLWAAWPFFLAASFFGVTGWYFAAELFLSPTPADYDRLKKRALIRRRRQARRVLRKERASLRAS